MFSLPTTITIAGREVPVRTDFRVILEIFVMLADPSLSDTDKTEALLRMFYKERPEDIPAVLQAFRDFVDQKSAGSSKSAKSSPSLINWSHDFQLMVGPINHVLGAECRSMDYLHWYTFLAAYMEISPDSVFSQTLRIREKFRSGPLPEHQRRAAPQRAVVCERRHRERGHAHRRRGAGQGGRDPAGKHTEWIRMVAAELRTQLEALGHSHAWALYPLPAAAAGSLIPPSALQSESRPNLDGLANTIAGAIASMVSDSPEPVIRVYLDGKQLSDAVTKYQRRSKRAEG